MYLSPASLSYAKIAQQLLNDAVLRNQQPSVKQTSNAQSSAGSASTSSNAASIVLSSAATAILNGESAASSSAGTVSAASGSATATATATAASNSAQQQPAAAQAVVEQDPATFAAEIAGIVSCTIVQIDTEVQYAAGRSGAATATASGTSAAPVSIGSANPNAVEAAITDLGGGDGFTYMFANSDWAGMGQQFSQATAARNVEDSARVSLQMLGIGLGEASKLGIPLTSTSYAAALIDPSKLDSIGIKDFSFTSGGSTYTVANTANGMVSGTKNGQFWFGDELQPGVGVQYGNTATGVIRIDYTTGQITPANFPAQGKTAG